MILSIQKYLLNQRACLLRTLNFNSGKLKKQFWMGRFFFNLLSKFLHYTLVFLFPSSHEKHIGIFMVDFFSLTLNDTHNWAKEHAYYSFLSTSFFLVFSSTPNSPSKPFFNTLRYKDESVIFLKSTFQNPATCSTQDRWSLDLRQDWHPRTSLHHHAREASVLSPAKPHFHIHACLYLR